MSKKSLSRYLDENSTGYNYLFLAPVSVVAEKVFVKYELSHPPGYITNVPLAYLWWAGIVCSLVYPIFFITAAHIKFKYHPKQIGKFNTVVLIAVHVLFTMMLLMAALVE